ATGAALAGTLTVAASSGVATFSGLSIDKSGTGFVLTATGASLTADSNTFNITGVRSEERRVGKDAGKTGALGNQRDVTLMRDERTTKTTSSVTVSLEFRPIPLRSATGAALAGTLTVAASSGVATFSGLSIDKSGTGFVLTATGASLTADSNTFNITGV